MSILEKFFGSEPSLEEVPGEEKVPNGAPTAENNSAAVDAAAASITVEGSLAPSKTQMPTKTGNPFTQVSRAPEDSSLPPKRSPFASNVMPTGPSSEADNDNNLSEVSPAIQLKTKPSAEERLAGMESDKNMVDEQAHMKDFNDSADRSLEGTPTIAERIANIKNGGADETDKTAVTDIEATLSAIGVTTAPQDTPAEEPAEAVPSIEPAIEPAPIEVPVIDTKPEELPVSDNVVNFPKQEASTPAEVDRSEPAALDNVVNFPKPETVQSEPVSLDNVVENVPVKEEIDEKEQFVFSTVFEDEVRELLDGVIGEGVNEDDIMEVLSSTVTNRVALENLVSHLKTKSGMALGTTLNAAVASESRRAILREAVNGVREMPKIKRAA